MVDRAGIRSCFGLCYRYQRSFPVQHGLYIDGDDLSPVIISAAGAIYSHPKVETNIEFERSYLNRSHDNFDVILISVTSTYHPIQSGAYSLAEDYRYTVEALTESLSGLKPQ